MSHRIVIERDDGGVSVTQLSDEFYLELTALPVLRAVMALGGLPAGDPWPARWAVLVDGAIADTAAAWAAGPPHRLSLDRLEAARRGALDELAAAATAAEASGAAADAKPPVKAAAAAAVMAIHRRRSAAPALPAEDLLAARLEQARQAAIAAEVDKICAGSGFRMLSWHESELAGLPAGRTFRDAWHHVGNGQVAVHMERARAIHLGRIRAARNGRLAELDRAYLLADERGDHAGKRSIAAQKQALRDLPATVDLAAHATPEALAAAWPEGLPRP